MPDETVAARSRTMTHTPHDAPRKIIHIDMDAFYASVEQRDDPTLKGRPIAVGGSRERGVVAAASYEARAFGVRSAMPAITAKRLCPDLVFVKPRFDAYRAISGQIREVFAEHTALIEPVALDEAYLDVTENLRGIASATEVARIIRADILARTGLVASAGVSYNKFLSKVASDFKKPNALFVITPAMGPEFAAALPVGRFHGIGPVSEKRLKDRGILTGRDIVALEHADLVGLFGQASAQYFADAARGIDHRPVRANRVRKSVGAENTFDDDSADYAVLAGRLAPILDKVWAACEAKDVRGKTVTLKVKYADFEQITRVRSLSEYIEDRETIEAAALALLKALVPLPRPVRLLGVSVSNLHQGPIQEKQLGFAI
jgi:DNA polymerase IV